MEGDGVGATKCRVLFQQININQWLQPTVVVTVWHYAFSRQLFAIIKSIATTNDANFEYSRTRGFRARIVNAG